MLGVANVCRRLILFHESAFDLPRRNRALGACEHRRDLLQALSTPKGVTLWWLCLNAREVSGAHLGFLGDFRFQASER